MDPFCFLNIYGLGNIVFQTTVLLIIHNWYNREMSHIKPTTVHLRPVRDEVAYQAGWLKYLLGMAPAWIGGRAAGGGTESISLPHQWKTESGLWLRGAEGGLYFSEKNHYYCPANSWLASWENLRTECLSFLLPAYTLLISRRPYHPLYCMLLPYILSGNNTEMHAVFLFSVQCRIRSPWGF